MKRRAIGLVLGLAVAIVVGGIPAGAEVVEAIAARVGGGLITESEVRETMTPLVVRATREFSGQRLERELIRIRDEVLDLLIDEELIIQHGQTIGAVVSEREIDAAEGDIMGRNGLTTLEELEAALASEGRTRDSLRRELRRQLLVMQIRGQELAQKIRLTEGDLEQYYQDHTAEFTVPDMVDLGLIVIPLPEEEEAAQALREEIQGLVLSIRAGQDQFEQVARERSTDPSGLTGGGLGRLQRGSLRPEFEEKIFAMAAGEISDPFELEGRLHLFQVKQREVGGLIPLKEIKDRIRGRLAREKEDEAARHWLEELRARAFIEKRYE